VFTEHTHIVAVRPSGNVYAWDAVEQLNIKPKNWKDLLTDEPFVRRDIIHLQDPLNLEVRRRAAPPLPPATPRAARTHARHRPPPNRPPPPRLKPPCCLCLTRRRPRPRPHEK